MAELAKLIGVAPDVLENTVKSFNAACVEGTFKPLETDGLATRPDMFHEIELGPSNCGGAVSRLSDDLR